MQAGEMQALRGRRVGARRGWRIVCSAGLGVWTMCSVAGEGAPRPEVFGIRLGEPLEAQLAACPADVGRWTSAARPCWHRSARGEAGLALPRALQSIAPTLRLHHLTEADGQVVQVEWRFRPADATGVERHVRSALGPPAEVEVFERHGRVQGLSRQSVASWKSAGTTLVFMAVGPSEEGLLRATLDRWAEAQAARARAQEAHQQQAAEARTQALREQLATPAAAVNGALLRRDAAEVVALLASAPDLNVAPLDGTTVLHTAAVAWGEADILRRLLDAGARIDARDASGRTALVAAFAEGHYRSAENGVDRLTAVFDFLVSRGADPLARGHDGRTPMLLALGTRHLLPVAQRLLQRGLPLPDGALLAALEGGAQDEDFRALPQLLDKVTPAHAAVRDPQGRLPLHLAARSTRTADLLGGLLAFGVPVDARDASGRTALVEAAAYGNLAAMQLLAGRGASVRAQERDGSTALHLAAGLARVDLVRWLVEQGADAQVRDAQGRRPADELARSARYAGRSSADRHALRLLLAAP